MKTTMPKSKQGIQLLRNLKPVSRQVLWISTSFVVLLTCALIFAFNASDIEEMFAASPANRLPSGTDLLNANKPISYELTGTGWKQNTEVKTVTVAIKPAEETPASAAPVQSKETATENPPEISQEADPSQIMELKDFKAELNNFHVDFSWTALAKTGNCVFTIERSLDSEHFEQVYYQKTSENSDSKIAYTASDMNPVNENTYYRLKQIQSDGQVNYSQLKRIESQAENNDLTDLKIVSAGPNPFRDKLKLSFTQRVAFDVDFEIINSAGTAVFIDLINGHEGMNYYEFTDQSGLPNGTYFLTLLYNHKKSVRKIIKN